MSTLIKQQTTKNALWKDETGLDIPVNRVTKHEKMREREAFKLASEALNLSQSLLDLKMRLTMVSQKVFDDVMEQHEIKKAGKGNFTWYNFDRSIKIEVAINENVTFDDTLLAVVKEKFDQFLSKNLSDKDEMIRQMILDAFSNTRGRIDSNKLMTLLKYKSKIKDKILLEAFDVLEKSIRRPDSKKYIRVHTKDENGEYQVVNLNISSI